MNNPMYEDEYYEEEKEEAWEYGPPMGQPLTPDMGCLVGVAMVIFLVIVFTMGNSSGGLIQAAAAPLLDARPTPTSEPAYDPEAFAAPYKKYVITQEAHGFAYGHLAIDLAATGNSRAVLAPINGVVTDVYLDQWGNTGLVIENEVYRVLLLHGDYSVEVGDEVELGDRVGTESNHGYTTDMAGNLCWGRAGCGEHTHLNVYDKRLEENVNPLGLIEP